MQTWLVNLALSFNKITYAVKATDLYSPQFLQSFLVEVHDELLHAQFLVNMVVALGGESNIVPIPVPEAATNREMLDAILADEL